MNMPKDTDTHKHYIQRLVEKFVRDNPGGSRVLRWLTFCSALDGHRATQEQAKNWPKLPKNGPKLAIFGCASEQRAVTDKLLNKMLDVMLMSVRCLLACSCLVQQVEGRPKAK